MQHLGPRGAEEAEILLGRAKLERQEFSEARSHIQAAVQRFPQSVPLSMLHVHSILKEGIDDRAAENALLHVLALVPDHAESTANLAALRARLQRPMVFATHPGFSFSARTIAVPSGGVRRLYRHVDVLNAHGMSAFVLHDQLGFRCQWFDNNTPILPISQAAIGPSDYLVVPEIYGAGIAKIMPGVPKIIFNQNAYFTFRGWPMGGIEDVCPYRHPDVVATLVVSQDSVEYLQYAFPGVAVHRLHYGIDPLFAPHWPKRRAIAFMPRKNATEVTQVLNLLRCRDALAGWDLVALDGLKECEVADRLRGCAIFLSFGHPEGFSLPPAEAMASGCVVIGYHGRGGREYFDPKFSYPVEVGDVVGFAKAVEEALGHEAEELGTLEKKGRQALEFIRANYSPQQEIDDIIGCWRKMLTVASGSVSQRANG